MKQLKHLTKAINIRPSKETELLLRLTKMIVSYPAWLFGNSVYRFNRTVGAIVAAIEIIACTVTLIAALFTNLAYLLLIPLIPVVGFAVCWTLIFYFPIRKYTVK